MENFDNFQTLLEIISLAIALSAHSPLLGIVAAVGALGLLIGSHHNDDWGNF